MNIEVSFWEKLSIRIVVLFLIAILSTFIPDYLHSFFGDWLCKGSGNILLGMPYEYQYCNYGDWRFHNPMWHWGWRHWLWCFMCITLFIVNTIRIVHFINTKDTIS